MSNGKNIQPVFILSDDAQRSTGRNAQRNNILAAKLVAETVRTTLGPKGMDKMLVDSVGEITVTNDGVTILEEMHIEHPAAKMVVEVARTQEDEVGDGTTSAVILAGELLKQAEQLLDDKLHPTVIIRGFRKAEKHAQERLKHHSVSVKLSDTQVLLRIAQTAMTGKGAESAKQRLAELAVKAVTAVTDGTSIDAHSIKIEKKVGGSVDDSRFIEGIILDKEKVHPRMPDSVKDARILLLDAPLELRETEQEARINITDPKQLQSFMDMEESMIKKMSDHVTSLGANVVICQKGVDDLAAYQLAKEGILVVRRVRKSDMEKLSKATGAKIVSSVQDASKEDLGAAGAVFEQLVGDEHMIFVQECKAARAVTVLVRAGTQHVVDEIERAVTDAIGDLRAAVSSGAVVAGAGSIEMLLAASLAEYASELTGREQLAVEAFSRSLEIIPRTLAENAGLDPMTIMTELRASSLDWPGVDVEQGRVIDAWKSGIIEPARIKQQALSSATDVACMILRIDDVIATAPLQDDSPI